MELKVKSMVLVTILGFISTGCGNKADGLSGRGIADLTNITTGFVAENKGTYLSPSGVLFLDDQGTFNLTVTKMGRFVENSEVPADQRDYHSTCTFSFQGKLGVFSREDDVVAKFDSSLSSVEDAVAGQTGDTDKSPTEICEALLPEVTSFLRGERKLLANGTGFVQFDLDVAVGNFGNASSSPAGTAEVYRTTAENKRKFGWLFSKNRVGNGPNTEVTSVYFSQVDGAFHSFKNDPSDPDPQFPKVAINYSSSSQTLFVRNNLCAYEFSSKVKVHGSRKIELGSSSFSASDLNAVDDAGSQFYDGQRDNDFCLSDKQGWVEGLSKSTLWYEHKNENYGSSSETLTVHLPWTSSSSPGEGPIKEFSYFKN